MSLKREIITLTDSLTLCESVTSDKGAAQDKQLGIVVSMLRQVFCEGQGTTLAFITAVKMLADLLTKSMEDHAYAPLSGGFDASCLHFRG